MTVTDGLHRFVTGLAQEHFELLENGTARALGRFANPDDPIAIATLSDPTAPPVTQLMDAADELIQASSLPEAFRQLAASKHFRKALVLPSGADVTAVPPGIQVLRADPVLLNKAVVELRNTYWLRFQTSGPSARIEVVLKEPRGLPVLKAGWKNSF